MRLGRVALLLLLPLPAAVAHAQLCVGNSAFTLAHFHSAAGADLDRLAQRYTLELRYRTHHAFGAAEYGLKTWELTSLNGTSKAVGLTLGVEGTAARSRVAVCPMVRWTYNSGPHEIAGTPWNFSESAWSAGLSVGVLMARSKLWDLMPTMGLTFGTADQKLTTLAGGNLQQYQDWCCGRRGFTTFRIGFGLGYSDEVTLIPSLSLPVGGAAQKTWGIRAAFRLGKGL
jgi:hypothetical protein